MYVWEDSKHQNWDGERIIILLIQSLPKKIIVSMATKSRLFGSRSKYKIFRATMQKVYSKRAK